MSDDLVKRLRMRVASESDNAICMTAVPNSWLHKEAADRIEALEAALAEKEAEVARLRDALTEIADRHIPDQPAGFGGDELQWAQRQHGSLRAIARAALNTPDPKAGG